MASNIIVALLFASCLLSFIIAVIAIFRIDRLSKCAPHYQLAIFLPYLCIFVPIAGIFLGVIAQQFIVASILVILLIGVGIVLEVKYIFKSQPQHQWKGCKCTRCDFIRDEQHDLNAKNCTCRSCGKVDHDLVGCDCKRCGQAIHVQTLYGGCKCERCHLEVHTFANMTCIHCGKTEPHECVYHDHYCTLCGVYDGYFEPEFNGG